MSAGLDSDLSAIAIEGMLCRMVYRYAAAERDIATALSAPDGYESDRYFLAIKRLRRRDAAFRRLAAALRRHEACVMRDEGPVSWAVPLPAGVVL